MLSFDELKALATVAKPKGTLAEKLNAVLTTPSVGNDASVNNVRPHEPAVPGLGAIVRAASWNIERGLNFDLIESALGSPEQFERESGCENRAGKNNEVVRVQLRALQETDVLILNEVDLGMKRTEYRDVSRDLAAALHMNYAYAVEFVEVDPVFDLGIETIDLPDKNQERRLEDDLQVDAERYRGLHGNAVLSRYPIERAHIVRLPVCYDWYGKEMEAIAKLEQGKRWSARKLFRERIAREVRRGGRMALMVDLAVPALPTGKLTVIAVHLENKCPPECRQRQMKALLSAIQSIDHPVILAGDLNTSGRDGTPTSVRNEIMKRVTDYGFWVNQAIFWFSPVSIPHYATVPLRYFHQHLDPTAWHFPFLWENRERGLFQSVERLRFSDGYAFDFRGRTERTLNKKERTLANSNQRGRKGFIPTYAFERTFGGWVGNFKLDWFFVKPFIENPRAAQQSYRFAPHFPITMNELNQSAEDRISDHPPMTVDLPLAEPFPLKTSSR
jgi:endonuclease/exonuclease/phosphatase family metal-dependent hydrolase